MALPGRRVHSDEDIVGVIGEALSVFGKIVDEYDPPGDLRVAIFGNCLHMVGTREIAQIGQGLQGLPNLKGPMQ